MTESAVPERYRSTSAPMFAGLPYRQQPTTPVLPWWALLPTAYAPVKCPECGVWWRTATHSCGLKGVTGANL